ncbi:MAG: zf-HC2 domain-containing protein [Bacteroidetes bacterium]|nr:zf-HC2 domain-containing protein [Bacteroidota bacterium]MCW5897301.1 zf-HC2 domain-containing protein [Bacteroidota bacterium]
MSNNHLTNEHMQLLVDGNLPTEEAGDVQRHLNTCTHCAMSYRGLVGVHDALMNMPTEHVGSDFTQRILGRLGVVPRTPFLFRLAENLAYVFALMIVLGIMLSVFTVTGVLNTQQLEKSQSAIGEVSGKIATSMNSFLNEFTVALQSYLPFVFGSGSLKIALMGTIIVGMLALADRLVRRRVLRH